jgi:dTDP-4-dehydrorhamnose 3,5-epimerase
MKVLETRIRSILEIQIDPRTDDRGLFARTFDTQIFKDLGIDHDWPQSNVSFNGRRGTLRGMHFQNGPYAEPKLVRCTLGRAYDVAVDLRPGSDTFHQWVAIELDAERRNAIYIPAGFAHGFLTLTDDTELFYHMGASYVPNAANGVRWDDPTFAIEWPFTPIHMSERDATYPDVAQ